MSTAPPGWHPDPTNPNAALRYWDGSAWTQHTHPQAAVAPAVPLAPVAPAAPYAPPPARPAYASYPAYGVGSGVVGQRRFLHRNTFTLVTIGFVLLYVVLAFAVHIVLLGILPVIMCVRAFRAKEPLAPLAAVAAVGAVGFALLALA
jgi:Protein of unknown function (DUF2510)